MSNLYIWYSFNQHPPADWILIKSHIIYMIVDLMLAVMRASILIIIIIYRFQNIYLTSLLNIF